MNIIRCTDARYPAVPASWIASSPLYLPGSLNYYRDYFNYQHQDHSFAVVLGGHVYGRVLVTQYQQQLNYFSLPVLFWVDPMADHKAQAGAKKVMLKEFKRLCTELAITQVHYQVVSAHLDDFAEFLLTQGYGAEPALRLVLDLTVSEETLWQQLRDVYRSNIRWGQQHLHYQIIDQHNASSGCLEAMRLFHIQVAGKETRSAQTWRIQEQMLAQGEAFALMGYEQTQQLVSTGFFSIDARSCYYGVGVYDRSRFDVPLSHDLVWRGMLHAKAQGCVVFEFGEIAFAGQARHGALPSDKEVSIGHFKRGFGGRLFSVLSF